MILKSIILARDKLKGLTSLRHECHVNLKVSHVTEKGESSGTESYSVQKRSSKIVTRVWHNDYKLTDLTIIYYQRSYIIC